MAPSSVTPVVSTQTVQQRCLRKDNNLWVDPYSLPKYGDASQIGGNASQFVKQLICNTFGAYAVGGESCFGHSVAKGTKFLEVDIIERRDGAQGPMEVRTVAEVVVTKDMLNGKGMTHGGCLAYIIDNCACTPLIVLGLLQQRNGVGVTQNLNINFHSPAPLGTCLRIISTSVTLGSRIMSSRCEIVNKACGRVIASGSTNRMQPLQFRL